MAAELVVEGGTGVASEIREFPALPPMARAALWYGARGLRVHPLRSGSKLPVWARWQERATTDPQIISNTWKQSPDAGIGIATGAASGVIVIDGDHRHGGDDTLASLEREHGEIPPTWRCLTPGGLHLYIRHPGGHVGNRVGLWPGIDLRGDGGYVVAPPTALADGRSYVWEVGNGPHGLAPIVAPTWLLDRIRPAAGPAVAHPPDFWRTLVSDGVDQGGRNHAVAQVAGHLLRRLDPYVALELVLAWNARRCRPPLSDYEVTRTVDSIARREAARREALS